MPKAKHNRLKSRLAQLEKEHAPVERNFWFWLEHAMHWYLFLFAIVAVLACAYCMFDKSAPAWAQVQLPY